MKKLPFLFFFFSFAAFAQGTWTQKQSFTTGRIAAASFDINGKGYMVGGLTSAGGLNDTWEYSANTWTQKANFPGGQRGAMFCFATGGKGYCGLGGDGMTTAFHSLYAFDPATNTWTQKANCPGVTIYTICNMVYNGKGYYSNGLDSASSMALNETYEYDPSSNTWTARAAFPSSARFSTCNFSIGSVGYSCCGFTGTAGLNELWAYDMAGNSWTQKASFPGIARMGGCGFTIGLNGYYGLGLDPSTFNELNDLYRYNQASNTWSPMSSLPDTGTAFRTSFVLNGKGYAMGGETPLGTYVSTLWEFNPPVSSGMEENEKPVCVLSILPNPLTSVSVLDLSNADQLEKLVEIYDVNGKQVRTQQMKNDRCGLEKEGLLPGIYFVEVLQNGKSIAKAKLLVQ